jgi:hypothetical protein
MENELWQVFETSNGTFKMFNAYYDTRKESVIRIVSFINKVNPQVKTNCQLWYEGSSHPEIVETIEYLLMWYEDWSVNDIGSQPYLITCKNPRKHEIPTHVSLVENKQDQASNLLKVINNLPETNKKKPFAVCTKDLDFMEDQTAQIVEWIEILTLLGADKIFIYVIKIHPNMMKTLKYYESKGKVKVEMMTEPKGLPNKTQSLTQWLQNELISLNDCLYKHINEYEFLLPLDIDEIILPTKDEHKTWSDLVKAIETGLKERRVSYQIQNVFFLLDNIHEGEIQPEVPKEMFFLQNIHRAQNFSKTGVGSKAFQSTDWVVTMHNHYPIKCFKGLDFFNISPELAQLSHYRRDCENYPKDECEGFKKNTVRDVKLWKIKDEVIERVKKALSDLNG